MNGILTSNREISWSLDICTNGKKSVQETSIMNGKGLTHWRSEARVEGLVIEIEVTTGLDHVSHNTQA